MESLPALGNDAHCTARIKLTEERVISTCGKTLNGTTANLAQSLSQDIRRFSLVSICISCCRWERIRIEVQISGHGGGPRNTAHPHWPSMLAWVYGESAMRGGPLGRKSYGSPCERGKFQVWRRVEIHANILEETGRSEHRSVPAPASSRNVVSTV